MRRPRRSRLWSRVYRPWLRRASQAAIGVRAVRVLMSKVSANLVGGRRRQLAHQRALVARARVSGFRGRSRARVRRLRRALVVTDGDGSFSFTSSARRRFVILAQSRCRGVRCCSAAASPLRAVPVGQVDPDHRRAHLPNILVTRSVFGSASRAPDVAHACQLGGATSRRTITAFHMGPSVAGCRLCVGLVIGA